MIVKRLMKIVIIGFSLFGCLVPSTGLAWEFSLSGTFTFEYETYSQLGSNGFFGHYDQDNSGNVGPLLPNLAARNGWLGNELTGDNLVSGSGVAGYSQYADLAPQIKLNQAVSAKGTYRIGSWDNPYMNTSEGALRRSEYFNNEGAGFYRSISPGYWNTLWVEAITPWGVVSAGKRHFPKGIGYGWFMDPEEITFEGLQVDAMYGPMVYSLWFFPWRRGFGTTYPVLTDLNGAMEPALGGMVSYNCGPIAIGLFSEYWRMSQGPESQLTQGGRAIYPPYDAVVSLGTGFMKYTNGRFFLNSAVSWFNMTVRRNPSEAVPNANLNRYWEHWSGMFEFGAMAGPAKITFLWSYYPGPDRRAGRLIDRQPFAPPLYIDSTSSVYRDYSLILSYNYGSGNGSINYGGREGFMTDAMCIGARVDYAVAANLNVYGTFFYADRVSQGYGWGSIRPNPTDPNAPSIERAITFNRESVTIDIAFAPDAPNITQRNLGWEVGGGFDWKLLEGYLLRANFAYWQPGEWFKYACVDRTVPDWDVPVSGNNWGVNPNRTIDPIFGAQMKLEMEF
jgi:hypothetical protein